MTTIGAAWIKQNKNDDYYYSLSFDEAILPFTIDKNKRMVLKENKNKGDRETAPDFYIDVFVPDKNKKQDTKKEILENEEIPF